MSKFTGPVVQSFVDGGVWKSWDAERWNNRPPIATAELQATP